jgi:hypothetical protein
MAARGQFGQADLSPFGGGESLDQQYNIGELPAFLEALAGGLAGGQRGTYPDGTPWADEVQAAYDAIMGSLSALNVPGGGPRTPENQVSADELGAALQWVGARGWGGGVQQADMPTGFAPNGRSLAYYGANVAPFTDVYANPATGLGADMQQSIDRGEQVQVGFGQTAPANELGLQAAQAYDRYVKDIAAGRIDTSKAATDRLRMEMLGHV